MSLYKTHRPSNLSGLLLPEQIKQLIKDITSHKDIPQSILLSSEKGGVGKTSLALITARLINCHTKKEQCNCKFCSTLDKNGTGKDIIMINGVDFNTLDKVKQMKPHLISIPTPYARRKIIIIDELHRLSPEAQSLFLDFLEFGKQSTIFIFTTTSVDKILEPLVTRMSHIELPTISFTAMWNFIIPIIHKENIKISKEDLRHLVVKSKGSLRTALNELELFKVSPTYSYPMTQTQTILILEEVIKSLQVGATSKAYPLFADLVKDNPTENMAKILLFVSRTKGYLDNLYVQIAKAFLSTKPLSVDEAFLVMKIIIPKKDRNYSDTDEIMLLDDDPTINQMRKPLPIYEDPTSVYYVSMLKDLLEGKSNPAIDNEYRSFCNYMDSLSEEERNSQIPSNQLTHIFMERYYRTKNKYFSTVEGEPIDCSQFVNTPNLTVYVKGDTSS